MRFSEFLKVVLALSVTIVIASTVAAEQKIPYTVAQIQKALNDARYDAGKPDGIWGKRSAKALKSFQLKRGIEVTGRMDPATMSKLFPIQEALRKKLETQSTADDGLQRTDDVAESVVVTPIERTALATPTADPVAALNRSTQELVTMLRLAEYGIGSCRTDSIDAAKVSKKLVDLLGPQKFTDIDNELRVKGTDIARGYPTRVTDFPSNTCAEWGQMANSRGVGKLIPEIPTPAPKKSSSQSYLVIGGIVLVLFLVFRGRRTRNA